MNEHTTNGTALTVVAADAENAITMAKSGRREIKTEKRKDLGNGPQAMETTTITSAHSIQSPLQLISSFRLSISVLSRRTFSVSVSSRLSIAPRHILLLLLSLSLLGGFTALLFLPFPIFSFFSVSYF